MHVEQVYKTCLLKHLSSDLAEVHGTQVMRNANPQAHGSSSNTSRANTRGSYSLGPEKLPLLPLCDVVLQAMLKL